MDSTSSSSSKSCAYALRFAPLPMGESFEFALSDLGLDDELDHLELSEEGSVVENLRYRVYLVSSDEIVHKDVTLLVNGSARYESRLGEQFETQYQGRRAYAAELDIAEDDRQVFILTYGFVRIAMNLEVDGESSLYLSTRDVVCLSDQAHEGCGAEEMMSELFSAEGRGAASWMFAGGSSGESKYSVIEGSFQKGLSKSTESLLLLIQDMVAAYTENLPFFRLRAKTVIRKKEERIPLNKVRSSGARELIWLSKNADVLERVNSATSIKLRNRYYAPRYIETERQVKSYDVYENRIVVSLLEAAGAKLKDLQAALHGGDYATLREKVSPLGREGFNIPSLLLIDAIERREEDLRFRISRLRKQVVQLLSAYRAALPEVSDADLFAFRPTKTFQEVRAYCEVAVLVKKWVSFGDFSLDRENLLLRLCRLDKLYEYYALFKLLEGLASNGFELDAGYTEPVERAEYRVNDPYHRNEKGVYSLYHLRRADLRIDLYYQPVIYGDSTEVNGISLHRGSKAKSFGDGGGRDTYYKPDYLLVLRSDLSDEKKCFILDAKYSAFSTYKFESQRAISRFRSLYNRYVFDIQEAGDPSPIQALWLLCGREQDSGVCCYRFSSWLEGTGRAPSGLLSLNPRSTSLHCLFEVMGILKSSDEVAVGDLECAVDKASASREMEPPSLEAIASVDESLTVVLDLISTLYDSKVAFNAEWASKELGLSRPLLRKQIVGRGEAKYYREVDYNGARVFVYSMLKPHERSRMRRFLRKAKGCNSAKK